MSNLVNKRRQHTESIGSSIITHGNTQAVTNEFRPTKSIIIGRGQPILIPGQINVTNNGSAKQTTNSLNFTAGQLVKNDQSLKNPQPLIKPGGINSVFGNTDIKEAISLPANMKKMTIDEQKMISVEEFCPEGEMVDKGFLDDIFIQNQQKTFSEELNDSDR